MLDLAFLGLVVAFFAFSAWFVTACDGLMRVDRVPPALRTSAARDRGRGTVDDRTDLTEERS